MKIKVIGFILYIVVQIEGRVFKRDENPECGYQACTKIIPEGFNVHLVPHSHDDVGWLDTVDGYFYNQVQNIISSVITALKQNPERRYSQVETAFFKKWWEKQNDQTKEDVRKLINNGQFEIINGGWSMNDEGAVNYQSTIDQFTFALKYLEDNLGKCSRPKIGWQIDPFGHSREQASIYAQMGFDGFFFTRLDLRDRANRENKKTQDFLWRGSANLGNNSDIFGSVIYKHYSFPSGFCFDHACSDEPIIDDDESPDNNYEQKITDFADYIRAQAETFPTNNILITMGDDFRYQGAFQNYINIDKLTKGFNLYPQYVDDKLINVFYSTPTCYVKAVNDYVKDNDVNLEMVTDDFFPFGNTLNGYFNGYFTSRPTSKRFERQGNNLLQVVKQITASSGLTSKEENVFALKDAMGVYQHHDAITGTDKQHVADSYRKFLANAFDLATDAASSAISFLLNPNEDDFDMELKTCILTNVSFCQESKSDKFSIVLYNPLSRSVSHHVYIPVDSENWKITDSSGNSVDYQIISSIKDFSYISDIEYSNQNLVFYAENLNPLGINVYTIEKSDSDQQKIKSTTIKDDSQIGFEDTFLTINEETGLLKSVTMNGVSLDVTQEFLYYEGNADDSDAYVFRPVPDQDPKKLYGDIVQTTVTKGEIFHEVLQEFNDYVKQSIKIYKNEKNFIEFDWIVGPINMDDGIGKEIISRFTTNLETDATFYTDSNGREMLQRIRNYRATYEYTNEEPISGNYYPINSKIVLKDENNNIEFAVLTDRSEGGSSIIDGQVELMVHRHCLAAGAAGDPLTEEQYGQGIVVRGQHYLVIGPKSGTTSEGRSIAAIERDVAQRKLLSPWTFITTKDVTSDLKYQSLSLLKRPLEDNVQILTLENWENSTILLRLEHILEKEEDENLSEIATVDLEDLFLSFEIIELKETTLAGNELLEESVRLDWPGSEFKLDEFNPLNLRKNKQRDETNLKISLAPMQIRTFLAKVEYNFDY